MSATPASALGRFLAEKRALVMSHRPAAPNRKRRRGIRREELATLADVSITDYARIEQGLEDDVSREELGRIAESLRLSEGEREKAFALAGLSKEAALKSRSRLNEVLDAMKCVPAFACNGLLDVLAFNPLAGAIFDFEGDGTAYASNQLWRIYCDRKRRGLYANPREEQAQLLDYVRDYLAGRTPDAPLPGMLQDLIKTCPAFERDWVQGFQRPKGAIPVAIKSARLGRVYVEPIRLSMFGCADEFMVMLMASGKGSRSALRKVQRTMAKGQVPQASWHYGPKHLRTIAK